MIDAADLAAGQGDVETLHTNLAAFGGRLLAIKPFCPDGELEAGWQDILKVWLSGAPISEIGDDNVKLIDLREMRDWVKSDDVALLILALDWPSPELTGFGNGSATRSAGQDGQLGGSVNASSIRRNGFKLDCAMVLSGSSPGVTAHGSC